MADSNVASFIINLTGNAKTQMDKMNKSFTTAKVNGKAAATAAKTFQLNIADLKGEIAILERKRMFANSRDELTKINNLTKQTQRELKKLENYPPTTFISRIKKAGEALTGLRIRDLGTVYAAAQVKRFVSESVKLYDVQAKAEAQLRASLEATGYAAGRSFAQLTKSASGAQMNTLFGDEKIIQAQSRLLTYTNIKGNVFDKTMALSMDYAAKKQIDLSQSSELLGKAINEPARYLGRLAQSGITFSESVEKQIKALDAAGNKEAAQLILLTELQNRYGGAAKEAALAGMGPLQQLGNLWNDFKEKIGKNLLETVNQMVPSLKKVVLWLTNHGTALKNTAKAVGIAAAAYVAFKLAQGGVIAISKIATTAVNVKTIVMRLLTSATKRATMATQAFNAAQKANLIGLVVAGLAAAVTAFIAFKKRAKDATDYTKEAKEAAAGYYAQERSQLDQIFAKLRQTNPATAERKRLVKELAEAYPELNKQQLQDLTYTNDLSKAYSTLIDIIGKRARAQALNKTLEDLYSVTSDIDLAIDKRADEISKRDKKRTKAEIRQEIEDQIKSGVVSWDDIKALDTSVKKLQKWSEAYKKIETIKSSIADFTFTPAGGTPPNLDPSGTSSAVESITSGGRQMKNFYITINDGLIKENNNIFNSSQDNPASADNFMQRLSAALLGVVNDVNYMGG